MTDVLFELRGVSKRFERGGTTIKAVDGIDLEIAPGEFVALEGPSGSGKTTPAAAARGTRPAGRRVIFFEGRELQTLGDTALAELRSRAFGFVFQQFNLIPTLSAIENVEAALAPTGMKGDALRARAATLLEEVGLADRSTHLPSHLSGGEQQRVAIARALANEPRVILADEPTGNLDTKTGGEVIELLAGLGARHGTTIIVATHDTTLAARAPRRIAMRDGAILESALT